MILNLAKLGRRKNFKPSNGLSLCRLFSSKKDELYERLGVPKTADEKDIKKAYKKATLKHHPDKGGNPEEFKKI